MSDPAAYFITFTTYGTWLHGRALGSVDRRHNTPGTTFLPSDPDLLRGMRDAMCEDPYTLDEPRRSLVLDTLLEVATHRSWILWAAHVRSCHIHCVVTSMNSPEKVMSDLKAWATRRLREVFSEPPDRKIWTQHGSTRWLNDESALVNAIRYVVDEQGTRMACYVRDNK